MGKKERKKNLYCTDSTETTKTWFWPSVSCLTEETVEKQESSSGLSEMLDTERLSGSLGKLLPHVHPNALLPRLSQLHDFGHQFFFFKLRNKRIRPLSIFRL